MSIIIGEISADGLIAPLTALYRVAVGIYIDIYISRRLMIALEEESIFVGEF